MSVATQRVPLTRERVLDAAVQLADSHGIDALTLRRLAEDLNVHPSSIYHHVPNKDAILDGIAGVLIQEARLPSHAQDWQGWVRDFASALRSLAKAHPGGFEVFTRRPANGPAAADQLEMALAAFRRGGFSPLRANEAVAGISLTIIGLTISETARFSPPPDPGTAHFQPDRYPNIVAVAEVAPPNTDGMWALVIEGLIAGIAPG